MTPSRRAPPGRWSRRALALVVLTLLGLGGALGVSALEIEHSPSGAPGGGGAHPGPAPAAGPAGPFYAVFSAPALVGVPGGVNYSFEVDGTPYAAAAGVSVNVSGLAAGPHTISAITASPAMKGWAYYGSASTGAVLTEPGTLAVTLTYAYVNLTLPNITVGFEAPQLPPGTPWGLFFNGTFRSSTLSEISLTLPPGDYERVYEWAIGLQGNVEYRTNTAPDYSTYSASTILTVNYSAYFELGVYSGPGGAVFPPGVTWVVHNSSTNIYAVGSSGDFFKSWTGVGVGNYSGQSPVVNITLGGPVTEFAVFLPRPNNTGIVRFQEHGMPNGTVWTVFLGGTGYSSASSLLVISGLVPCANLTAGAVGVYSATYPDDYQNLTTPGLSERFVAVGAPALVCGQSERIDLNYTTQYLVLDHWTAGGTVTAAVNGTLVGEGYFAPGTTVTFQATPTFGYSFAGWSGVGPGAYSGSQPLASVSISGSIDELGSFAAGPLALALGYPVTFEAPAREIVGTAWTVAVDGQAYAANGSQLTVPDVTAGNHTVSVGTVWGAGGGSRSVPVTPNFSITVAGPSWVNLSYNVSYWLTVVVVGAGTVSPGSGWVAAGGAVQLVATAAPGAAFLGWASAQAGGYNGNTTSNATLVLTGPLVESATFGAPTPPPDFWHRTTTLAAAAIAGLVGGALVVALILRFRRGPPRSPTPPAGAVREWRGVLLRRTPPRTPPPASPRARPPIGVLLFLVVLTILAGPAVGTIAHSGLIAPGAPVWARAVALPPTPSSDHAPVAGDLEASSHPGTASLPAAQAALAGSNVTFRETGLPIGVTWSVSTWPYASSEAAPATWSTTGANLTAPVGASESSLDFLVWTVPLNSTTAWLGTTNVSGPINANQTPVVGVAFAPATISGLPLRFHIVETGLPAGQAWHTSILGVGYDVQGSAADYTVGGGKTFVFTAPIDVLSPGVEYVPLRFDVESLTVGASWSNGTTNPVVRLANAPFWIDVNFTPEYRVHVVGDAGGTVTPSSGWYPGGQPIAVTASPQAGYAFINWSGIGVGSTNSSAPAITVTPGSAIVEIASFAVVPFVITVEESGIPLHDDYSVVYDGTIYTFNTSVAQLPGIAVGDVTLTAIYAPSTLHTGERFVPENVTASYAPGTNGTFYVDGNGTISITFGVEYALTITSSGTGTTDPAPGSYWEPAGAGVAVRALPGPSLALENWRGSGNGSYSGAATGIVVAMNGPIDEAAQFGLPLPAVGSLLTVTESGLPPGEAWSAAAGALGGSGATSSLVLGPLADGPTTLVVPTVVVGAGERFVAAGGGASRFALTGNQSFAITFQLQWLVNVTVLFGGSVADYPSWVPANATVSLLAEPPSPGYQFNGWAGTVNSTAALITFTANTSERLTAQFAATPNSASSGPKDAPIAAADVGIPAAVGALGAYFWFRRRA